MNQICRVLFAEEENENLENDEGGNLANIGEPKRRRGQRQKWSQAAATASKSQIVSVLADTSVLTQTRSSRARNVQGMSVLADIQDSSVLSQPIRRTLPAVPPKNSISVLAGIDDASVVSQSPSREKHAEGSNGGLLSLFAVPAATQKTSQATKDKGVAGGLFGFVGIESKDSHDSTNDSKAKNGRRGRQSAKRVTWANESSLVSKNVSVMATESKVKSIRNGCCVNQSIGSGLVGSRPKLFDDGWRLAFGDARISRRQKNELSNSLSLAQDKDDTHSRRTLKPVKRKNNREGGTFATSFEATTPEKDDPSEAFITTAESPVETIIPDSEVKPTKRVDKRRTPEKLEAKEWSAEKKKQPECLRPSNEPVSPGTPGDNDEKLMEAPPPVIPSSKVLEVEYIPVSVSVSAYTPSPADALSDQGTHRSLHRPIPTDKFSPSIVMKEAQQMSTENSPLASPSSPSPMEIGKDAEPVKRRSARPQMQTDRFSPSVAMMQAQFKANMPLKDVNRKRTKLPKASKAKATKSIIKKKLGTGRPPRNRRDAVKPPSKPDASNESNNIADSESEGMELKASQSSESISTDEVIANDLSIGEDWDDKQLLQLKQSHSAVDPTSTSFWIDIAEHVDGKSVQECRERWFSLVKTPAQRAKKAGRKDTTFDLPDVNDDEDDIFNSTPLRGTLFPYNTKSLVESEETNDIDFHVGSPLMMSARRNRRVSTEYDDGNETHSFQQQKVGYKSYMMGLKRGVARAIQDKKDSKNKKGSTETGGTQTLTESVGNGDVSLKGHLTPGGTLKLKNLTEAEDDFLDYLSETSDCED